MHYEKYYLNVPAMDDYSHDAFLEYMDEKCSDLVEIVKTDYWKCIIYPNKYEYTIKCVNKETLFSFLRNHFENYEWKKDIKITKVFEDKPVL